MTQPRLDAALARRAPLFRAPHTNAFRLLHRAADGFPTLAVDRFADVLVAHLYEGASAEAARPILSRLASGTRARAVYVKHRPRQASVVTEPERADLAPTAPLIGEAVEALTVLENGLSYLIRPAAGLSVGLFLDMREVRAWVRRHAAGKMVLNCFAYTCGFGVAATKGEASRVINLDVARGALDWGQRNYELNGLAPEARDFIAGDVFDWLRRLGKRGQTFDVVILDPPSYSTTKRRRFSVQRDYAELVALAARVTTPGGRIVACANAVELPLGAFKKQLRAGLESIHAPARLTRTLHEPAIDFPVARGSLPYLKICLIELSE